MEQKKARGSESLDEMKARMKDAGFEEDEIAEVIDEISSGEKRKQSYTAYSEMGPHPLKLTEVAVISMVEEDTQKRIECLYGRTKFTFTCPLSFEFHTKDIDFAEINMVAFKQMNGHKYDELQVSLNLDGQITDIKIDGAGSGIPFERIRRITGYLVGSTERFNDAKKAETASRVKHDLTPPLAKPAKSR